MSDPPLVSEATTRRLADLAELPLAEGRAAILAPQLNVWITLANELNRKMSDPRHWTLTPITVFSHPRRSGEI
jgi:hypothetical protein